MRTLTSGLGAMVAGVVALAGAPAATADLGVLTKWGTFGRFRARTPVSCAAR